MTMGSVHKEWSKSMAAILDLIDFLREQSIGGIRVREIGLIGLI